MGIIAIDHTDLFALVDCCYHHEVTERMPQLLIYLLFVFLFAKGEFLIRSSIETISHTAILGTHIYFLRYTAVSIIFLFSFSSHFTRSFRLLGSLLRNLNFSLDDSPVSLGLSV